MLNPIGSASIHTPTVPTPKVHSDSPLPQNTYTTDRLSVSHRSALGMSTIGMVGQPQGSLVQNPKLSPELQSLRNSNAFRTVYRNFDLVPADRQEKILQKLTFILQKYPDFLDKLSHIDNPQYGEGFQFYFIPQKSHERWQSIPEAVRGTADGYTDYIGIVYSSPLQSIKHPVIGPGMNYFSQGAIALRGLISSDAIGLDIGGMYAAVSEDTFAHEMGHVLHSYFMSNADRLEIWSIYSESKATDKGFITEYARTNHMEFLAEGIETYLEQNRNGEYTGRERLKKVNPDLYRFVERMLEPTSPSNGQDPYVSSWKLTKYKAQRIPVAVDSAKELGNKLVAKVKGWFN